MEAVRKLVNKVGAKSIKNILWLLGDHAITFLGGFFISIWLARHLGPSQYGVYAFALAAMAIAASLAQLGLGGIAVKDLVKSDNLSESLGTISLLKLLGGISAYVLLISYLTVMDIGGDKYWIAAVIGLRVLFAPFSVIDNLFDSRVISKYKVLSRKSGYILRCTLIIAFILSDWPFRWLAYILISEQLVAVSFLIYFFLREKIKSEPLRFSSGRARRLLNQSWPLIISGLGAMLYLKMDQIMVVSMVSDQAGGQYAAAVRYTSIFYFIHSILLTTFFPKLIKKKQENNALYLEYVSRLAGYLILISAAVIVGTYFFIDPFIRFTYGEAYLPSVSIIFYHIWCLPLVYLGAVLSKWLILENITKFSLLRHGMGLIANLVFNLALIPIYGPVGAAIASIVALFFSVIVVLIFHPKLRLLGQLILGSVFTLIRKRV